MVGVLQACNLKVDDRSSTRMHTFLYAFAFAMGSLGHVGDSSAHDWVERLGMLLVLKQ